MQKTSYPSSCADSQARDGGIIVQYGRWYVTALNLCMYVNKRRRTEEGGEEPPSLPVKVILWQVCMLYTQLQVQTTVEDNVCALPTCVKSLSCTIIKYGST